MLEHVASLVRRLAHPKSPLAIEESTLSSKTAYGLLYTSLIVVAGVAIVWSYIKVKFNHKKLDEGYVSARSTQPWWAITASFFSSAMGAWVLSAPADIGSTCGAWGVIGYALATGMPWAFLAFFGPRMRRLTDGRGFTSTDFIRSRLGFGMHILYTAITFGSVFLSFVVEAVTIGQIFTTVSPKVHQGIVTSSVAIAVLTYTGLSGISATLLTDRLQFVVLMALIVIGLSCIFFQIVPKISHEAIAHVGHFTTDGFVALLVLNISCWFPTFMDPSSWSRMYAADSEHAAKKGLNAAAVLLLIPMTFFGVAGIISQAGQNDGVVLASDSTFFALFKTVNPAWAGVLLLLATCLSVSTIDTYTSAFASCVAAEINFNRRSLNFNWCRGAALLVFVLALITALENPPSVMTLFMVGNLLGTVSAPGLLLSLWDWVSPIGVLCGMLAGALTIFSIGWVRLGTFIGGFHWWLLPEGSTDRSALVTFVLAGTVTTISMILFSRINFWLDSGCRDRQRKAFEDIKLQNMPDLSGAGELRGLTLGANKESSGNVPLES